MTLDTYENKIGEKLRALRVEKGLSIQLLSDLSGIASRTIQRIELGESKPRGFTLTKLAEALECDLIQLTTPNFSSTSYDENMLKKLNLSALFIVMIPLSNLIFPLYLWSKTKHIDLISSVGSNVINFQIIWTIITAILLVAAPFVFLLLPQATITSTGAIIFTYLGSYVFNIGCTLVMANHIYHKRWEKVYPKAPKLL